jgi:hypothetical protein
MDFSTVESRPAQFTVDFSKCGCYIDLIRLSFLADKVEFYGTKNGIQNEFV